MSDELESNRRRLEELHACRLLFSLSPEEQAEYDELVAAMPNDRLMRFDEVVAELDIAYATAKRESLPPHLRQTIADQAQRELAALRTQEPVSSRSRGVRLLLTYAPWLVSAACIALTIGLWGVSGSTKQDTTDRSQSRAELLMSAEDLVQARWSPGPTPVDGSKGDIVWSSRQQRGFMRFLGLRKNIPTLEQYQLWIFDRYQSDQTPIDGGVFDVNSEGEVIIPIEAKLRVQEASMFAITLEKPGGVVVSSRERLLLVAKVD